mgnify:CR=1 FL=1
MRRQVPVTGKGDSFCQKITCHRPLPVHRSNFFAYHRSDLSKVLPVTGRYLFTGQIFSPVTGLTCQRFCLSQVVTCSQVNFFRLSQVWPVKGSTCHRSLPVHRSIFSTCHSSDLSQASPVTGRHLLTGRKNLPVTGWPVTCHLSPLTIEIFFF